MQFEPTTPESQSGALTSWATPTKVVLPPHAGAPAGIRPATAGLEGRVLYPVGATDARAGIVASPLRNRMSACANPHPGGRGRGFEPRYPASKQARYQTALYPADGTDTAFCVCRPLRDAPASRKTAHCPARGPHVNASPRQQAATMPARESGGIGRRPGFRFQCRKRRRGSSSPLRTSFGSAPAACGDRP